MREQPPPTAVAVPSQAEAERRPDPLAAAVAEAVAKLRRAAGLSERAAARRLGTSQTQLRRMEDPRYLPSLRSLSRVAAAYGYRLTVEFLPQDAPAPKKPAGRPAPPKRRAANRSASPSKGRRAAPGRGRARGPARRRAAAPRSRS